MGELHGKVALVTGGSRGIGRATAVRLAEAGADVVIGYRGDDDAARRTVSELADLGVRAAALRWDFEDGAGPDFVEAALAARDALRAEGAGRPFDVVVHSAGIDIRKPLEEYSRAEVDRLMRVNLQAPFELGQSAARLVDEGGSLVFVSSTAAATPLPMSIPYGMTKAGVENLVRGLAVALDPHRIRVNGVAPGAVDTDLQLDRERISRMRAQGRAADPADIADVAVFLAGPQSRWVNGQIITATGRTV